MMTRLGDCGAPDSTDAVVETVGDEEPTVRRRGDALWPAEIRTGGEGTVAEVRDAGHQCAGPGDGNERVARANDFTNPLIAVVCDQDVSVGSLADGGRAVEVGARSRSTIAARVQGGRALGERAVTGDGLHCRIVDLADEVVHRVGDQEPAVARDRNSLREVQAECRCRPGPSRVIGRPSRAGNCRDPVRKDLADLLVPRVGDEDGAVGPFGHTHGVVELRAGCWSRVATGTPLGRA